MSMTNLGRTMFWVTAAIAVVGSEPTHAAGVAGEQRRWALHFRVRLEQADGAKPIDVGLRGEWVSTICAVRAGGYDAMLQVADPRVEGKGGVPAAGHTIVDIERRLSRPFWATYAIDGSLLAVHFFKDVNASDRNLLQMIATSVQLVRPETGKSVWTALERDGAGSYLAIYDGSDSKKLVKRKLKYVDTDGAPGVAPNSLQVTVDQSEIRFLLDTDGGIVGLDGSDRVRIGPSSKDAFQICAMAEMHLADLRKVRAPELVGSLSHSSFSVESAPILTHKPDPELVRLQHDERLLEGRTTESLLESATAQGYDPKLADGLTALFRRRPEAVVAALALLRKRGPQNRITAALGSAATPASTDALGKLARDRTLSAPLRVDALTALVVIQHPSPETMRIPISLMDDRDVRVESAARMVSGALARAGRTEHPSEASAIDAALISRFRSAREVPQLLNLLAALGNSVGLTVLPVIEEALRDERDLVRAAAARGLRLSKGPETDRLLAETITADADPGVRAAAIFAAGFRHPLGALLADALRLAATRDAVEYVRSDAVTLLRQNSEASAQVLKTLKWVAEHDSQPGVRRLAQEALAFASRSSAK